LGVEREEIMILHIIFTLWTT